MSVISWNESLVLNQTVMDQTHAEFVQLLNRLADASGSELSAVLEEFITHTEAHFAQEEQWMAQMAFPPMQCHAAEHKGVLEIALEVRRRVVAGEVHLAKVLAQATAEWFANHAVSMDAVLAMYMQQIDFQPGRDAQPRAGAPGMESACGVAGNSSGGCHAHQPEAAKIDQHQ